jgi:hypothetical protein
VVSMVSASVCRAALVVLALGPWRVYALVYRTGAYGPVVGVSIVPGSIYRPRVDVRSVSLGAYA